MIRFTSVGKDGRVLVGIGLSKMNVSRLQDDQPVLTDLRELGIDAKLAIFVGETEASMAADLQSRLGPDTRLVIDPRVQDGHD